MQCRSRVVGADRFQVDVMTIFLRCMAKALAVDSTRARDTQAARRKAERTEAEEILAQKKLDEQVKQDTIRAKVYCFCDLVLRSCSKEPHVLMRCAQTADLKLCRRL